MDTETEIEYLRLFQQYPLEHDICACTVQTSAEEGIREAASVIAVTLFTKQYSIQLLKAKCSGKRRGEDGIQVKCKRSTGSV